MIIIIARFNLDFKDGITYMNKKFKNIFLNSQMFPIKTSDKNGALIKIV